MQAIIADILDNSSACVDLVVNVDGILLITGY